MAPGKEELLRQVGAALATGNRALVADGALDGSPPLPAPMLQWVRETADWRRDDVAAILFSGSREDLLALGQAAAEREGPLVPIHTARDGRYPLEWLVLERSVSTNTTAAGGNANLMMIG